MSLYKCEVCESEFDEDNEDDAKNIDSLIDTGRCQDCYEEWGDQWPDRV